MINLMLLECSVIRIFVEQSNTYAKIKFINLPD